MILSNMIILIKMKLQFKPQKTPKTPKPEDLKPTFGDDCNYDEKGKKIKCDLEEFRENTKYINYPNSSDGIYVTYKLESKL